MSKYLRIYLDLFIPFSDRSGQMKETTRVGSFFLSKKKRNEDKDVRGQESENRKQREGEITYLLRNIYGAIWRSHTPT